MQDHVRTTRSRIRLGPAAVHRALAMAVALIGVPFAFDVVPPALAVTLPGFAAAPTVAPPTASDAAQPAFWYGTAPDGSPTVKLYFFWTPTCPHCRAAQPFVAGLRERLPWVEIVSRPVKDDPASARLYFLTARSLGVEATSVPGFLFCRSVEIGYDTAATTGEELVRKLRACRERILADPSAMTAAPPAAASASP